MADNIHEYEQLVMDALEVVEFSLIRKREDVDNPAKIFRPEMAHQIFGNTENIFGYKDLRIRVLYTAGPLHIYLGITYDQRVDDLSKGLIKADNVTDLLAQKLPDGCYFVNLDEFLKTLDKADKFQPFGEKISEHRHRNETTGEERLFEIYHCDYKSSAFLKFFARLQTFVLWYVDAASYIEIDDPQWDFFVCYEKYKNEDGVFQYATTGYTTVYRYFAYPQHTRPRISQMLVLPPFQKLGIGTKFLESLYQYYQTQKNITDITVEDPSPDFQRLRNCVDARLCLGLKSFSAAEIKKGFNPEMVREARDTYKINAHQCRRVYEILRLHHTNLNDKDEYTAYRLEVKRRLNCVYKKQMSDIEKMEKVRIETEWLRARLPSCEQRIEQLKDEYDQVEDEYKYVLEKMAV